MPLHLRCLPLATSQLARASKPTATELHVNAIDHASEGAVVVGFQISLGAFFKQRQL